MRPGPQPRTEGPTDEGGDDADVLRRDTEHRRDLLGHTSDPLRLIPQGHSITVPGGNGGVHLDRVVVLARDYVGLVNLDLGALQGSFGIAAPRLVRHDFTLVGLLVRRVQDSEEHTSELQSLMRISYAVFCLKTKTDTQ